MFDRLKKMLAPAAPVQKEEPGADALLINAYCTVANVPAPDFPHTLNAQRDLSDPELAPHLRGLLGYVHSRGDGQMTRTRYHLLRHVERVNSHLSLLVDQQHLDAFSAWSVRANAIAFLPDGGLRDPQGRVLMDAAGRSDDAAQIPYPREAWERKARSDALLAGRGIAVSASLPPLISEPELRPRKPQEVAGRALALLVAAVRAEALNSGDALTVQELHERLPLAFDYLSPKESDFLADQAPTAQEVVQFAWRYEGVYLLEWALGLVDDLPFPAAICDVPLTARTLFSADAAALLEQARLRPPAAILDALDLHYRLHWAAVEARQNRGEVPAGVEGGVVLERHYALNWLVRFEDAQWDDVTTPT